MCHSANLHTLAIARANSLRRKAMDQVIDRLVASGLRGLAWLRDRLATLARPGAARHMEG